MWAFIGYAVGIEDQFNTCLMPNLKIAKEYYEEMYRNYMLPSIYYVKLNEDAKIFMESFFRGIVGAMLGPHGETALPTEQFILLGWEDVLSIPLPNLKATMPMAQRVLRNTVVNRVT